MVEHPEYQTAKIQEGVHCDDCGWPIVFFCCNLTQTPYSNWDWWVYCANPTCQNHTGEGIFQNKPRWYKHDKK